MPLARASAATRVSAGPFGRFGEARRLLGADVVAGEEHLGTDQKASPPASGFRRPRLEQVEIAGDGAGLGRALIERDARAGVAHVSFCDQAPSSFGRSPNRAIRPNTTIASRMNITATDAMTGV